jgi:hypothetical protein
VTTKHTAHPVTPPSRESSCGRSPVDSYVTLSDEARAYVRDYARRLAEESLRLVPVGRGAVMEHTWDRRPLAWPWFYDGGEILRGPADRGSHVPGAGRKYSYPDFPGPNPLSCEKGVSMADALNTYLDQRSEGMPRSIDVAKGLVEGKEAVTVTFRQDPVPLRRAESPKRSHVFHQAGEFAAYLLRYGTDNVVVLVDPQTGAASAVLDELKLDGFEVIFFVPMIDAHWRPWQERIGRKIDVREFARFVGSQAPVIIQPNARTLEGTFSQVKLSRTLRVETGQGRHATNGIMVESHVKGQVADQEVELPEELKVKCPIFWGEAEQEIVVELYVNAAGDGQVPLVELRSPEAEAKRLATIAGIADKMRATLPKATVAIGQIAYDLWDYIGGVKGGTVAQPRPFDR